MDNRKVCSEARNDGGDASSASVVLPTPSLATAAADRSEAGRSDVAAEPAVRFDELVERCMGNLDLAANLLEQGTDFLINDMTMLRACVAQGDPSEVARLAHRLKGASANLGAYEFSDVCKRIEQYGRAGSTKNISDCLRELDAEWVRFTNCAADLRARE